MENFDKSVTSKPVGVWKILPSIKILKIPYCKVTPDDEKLIKKRLYAPICVTCQEYTIQNVSQYFVRDNDLTMKTVECPEFSTGVGIESTWCWRVKFFLTEQCNLIQVFANSSKVNTDIKAVISVEVIDDQNSLVFIGRRPDRYFADVECKIADIIDQYDQIANKNFFAHDSLKVRLKLTILDEKTPLPACFTVGTARRHSLPNHFKELYLSREDTGDLVVNIQKQTFRVHKEVLEMRCPFLFKQLNMQSSEDEPDSDIASIDCKVFEKLLEFLYLDKVTDIDDCIVPLWKASHEYQLAALKSICVKIISEDYLSLDNAKIINSLAFELKSGLSMYIGNFLYINKKLEK